jgi:RNA polymerase sigma-70 factor (ECF subfamily)
MNFSTFALQFKLSFKIEFMIEQIWNRYHCDLYSYILGRVKDRAVADDLLQDIFLKIQIKAEQLKERTKVKAWLYQIARNTIVDYYRSQSKINHQITEGKQLVEESKNQFEEIYSCIVPIINTLPSNYKDVLLLSEIDGMSQKELANQMEISYSALKSRVQRGRLLLKDALKNCCSFQHDRTGKVIDYEKRKLSCSICEH